VYESCCDGDDSSERGANQAADGTGCRGFREELRGNIAAASAYCASQADFRGPLDHGDERGIRDACGSDEKHNASESQEQGRERRRNRALDR